MNTRRNYRAPMEVLKYFLERHRDAFVSMERERRASLLEGGYDDIYEAKPRRPLLSGQ